MKNIPTVIVILCCCILFSALALGAWEWRLSAKPETHETLPSSVEDASNQGVTLEAASVEAPQPVRPEAQPTEPAYWQYPVLYGADYVGEGTKTPNVKEANSRVRVGFGNRNMPGEDTDKTYYAWKGVSIEYRQIPANRGWFRTEVLADTAGKVVEVDPPVFYLPLPDGSFAPGYYRKSPVPSTFYRWKGVTVKGDELPGDAREKRLLTEKTAEYTIDIDAPAHILARPKLWKRD